jgi:hypothetical protein
MSKKLQDRIEELERKVRDLEARPFVLQPIIVNPVPAQPVTPNPWVQPWGPSYPPYPITTCVVMQSDPNMLLMNGRALTS